MRRSCMRSRACCSAGLFGQYRAPYLATPYLLSASQFDKYQCVGPAGVPCGGTAIAFHAHDESGCALTRPVPAHPRTISLSRLPFNENGAPPYNSPAQAAYALQFQADVRSVMLNLPTAYQPGSAVFSSACFKHCTSNTPSFWGVTVDGRSLADVLRDWFFGTWVSHTLSHATSRTSDGRDSR